MKETGIIMSGDHPKLILDGRKTQTRRVVTPSTSEVGEGRVDWRKFCWDGSQIYRDTCIHGHTEEHKSPLPFVDGRANEYYPYEHQYLHVPYNWTENMTIFRIYPKWEVGDRLWVRETWFAQKKYDHLKPSEIPETSLIGFIASDIKIKYDWAGKTRSPLFMPRWASRILLEITEIRAERLRDITPEDCIAEGIATSVSCDAELQLRFRNLWDSLNAKRGYGWGVNSWVWVISFRRL